MKSKAWLWVAGIGIGILIGASAFALIQYMPGHDESGSTGQELVLAYDHFNQDAPGLLPVGYSVIENNGSVRIDPVPAVTNLSVRLSATGEASEGEESGQEAEATLRKIFPAQKGLLTAEVKFMQPAEAGKDAVVFRLMDGSKTAISLEAESGNLVYRTSDKDTEVLFENYAPDTWYILKVVADVETDLADVYVNGNLIKEQLPFYRKAAKLDVLESYAADGSVFHLDDIVLAAGRLDIPVGFASVGMLPTGGFGGETVTVSTNEDFYKYIMSDDPYVILVDGTIKMTFANYRVKSNKSIIGVGDSAVLSGGGLLMENVQNIVIRNIHFEKAREDSINIVNSHNIWIDHNSFTNGYDGLLDIRDASSYITVSWNRFTDHFKTSLVGHVDGNLIDIGRLKVTYHHNWFDGTAERHPRVRYGEVHVLNNYYDSNPGYGIRPSTSSSVFIEGNYFYNVKTPIDLHGDPLGQAAEKNNIYDQSGAPSTNGEVFDPFSYYTYYAEPAEGLNERVKEGAGPGKIKVP